MNAYVKENNLLGLDVPGSQENAWGMTNPINGKVLLAPKLLTESNIKLSLTFIHEQIHSIDVLSGTQNLLVSNIVKTMHFSAFRFSF